MSTIFNSWKVGTDFAVARSNIGEVVVDHQGSSSLPIVLNMFKTIGVLEERRTAFLTYMYSCLIAT